MRARPPRHRPARRAPSRARLLLALALGGALVALLAVTISAARVRVEVAHERLVVGQWQPLDVRAWTGATSGFRAPGQSDLPLVDSGPDERPMPLAGRVSDTTLGLYP